MENFNISKPLVNLDLLECDKKFLNLVTSDLHFDFSHGFADVYYHDHALVYSEVVDLIFHFLFLIHFYPYEDKGFKRPVLKTGYTFGDYNRSELVVYLHGLLNAYFKYVLHESVNNFVEKPDVFSRLPWEVVVNQEFEKPVKNIKYSVLPVVRHEDVSKCVCLLFSDFALVRNTPAELQAYLDRCFPDYKVHLYCDMPF